MLIISKEMRGNIHGGDLQRAVAAAGGAASAAHALHAVAAVGFAAAVVGLLHPLCCPKRSTWSGALHAQPRRWQTDDGPSKKIMIKIQNFL